MVKDDSATMTLNDKTRNMRAIKKCADRQKNGRHTSQPKKDLIFAPPHLKKEMKRIASAQLFVIVFEPARSLHIAVLVPAGGKEQTPPANQKHMPKSSATAHKRQSVERHLNTKLYSISNCIFTTNFLTKTKSYAS